MTRETLIKICTMRIDGYTYQEIADELECSRQNIQQTIQNIISETKSRCYSKSIYPNLMREIRTNYDTLTDFAKASGVDYRRLQSMLTGRVKVSITEVIAICKLFDKDVAYLFEKKTEERN